jgi:antitoxin component of MazEF toxin-antitoxin module
MRKKLLKHGNSLAILIDKQILDLLNINEDTYINIKTDGTNIIIEPVKEPTAISVISEDSKLQKLYKDLVDKYDAVLRKLSKN